MMRRIIPFYFCLFTFAFFPVCCHVYGANGSKTPGQTADFSEKLNNSQSPIHITADRMEADQDQKTIVFESHVLVVQDDVTITSNRLKVTLLEGETKTASDDAAGAQRIDFIEFDGDVKFTQLDRLATAKKAIYYQKEQKIVLHGRPVVTKGQDRVEGDLITIYVKDGRSIVEGGSGAPVQAVLFPSKKE
jgi:lipopolysaccharide export system protein LptA